MTSSNRLDKMVVRDATVSQQRVSAATPWLATAGGMRTAPDDIHTFVRKAGRCLPNLEVGDELKAIAYRAEACQRQT